MIIKDERFEPIKCEPPKVADKEFVSIPIWDYRQMVQTEQKYNMLTYAVLNQSKVSEYGNQKHILYPDIEKLFNIIEPELIECVEERLLKGERR